MNLIIQNYKRALDIKCNLVHGDETKITMFEASNGEGKSSSLQAIANLASGTKPREKKLAASKLTHGANDGCVSITHGNNQDVYLLPQNEFETRGERIKVSLQAVSGIKAFEDHRYVNMKVEDRFSLLQTFLKAEPTKEDLKVELTNNKDWLALVTEQEDRDAAKENRESYLQAAIDTRVDEAWQIIYNEPLKRSDWNYAHKEYELKRKDLKSRWCERTGNTAYQSDKGATWVPKGYTLASLEVEKIEEQEARLKTEVAKLEQMLKDQGADEQTIKRLEAQAKEGPDAEKTLKQLAETITGLEAKLKGRPQDASAPPEPSEFTCHNCGCPNFVYPGDKKGRGQKKPLEKSDDAETWDQVANDLNIAINNKRIAETMAYEAKEAAKLLPGLKEKTVTEADVVTQRKYVDELRERQKAVTDYTRALEIYKAERLVDALVTVTSPKGLKAKKLQEKIDEFNGLLQELSDVAEWHVGGIGRADVRIESDSSVTFGEPYSELSAGEALACDATIQAAIAMYDKSQLIVIDELEKLDRDKLVGLIRMLHQTDIPSVLARKVDDPALRLPAMIAGYGIDDCAVAYWLEGGKIVEPVLAEVG